MRSSLFLVAGLQTASAAWQKTDSELEELTKQLAELREEVAELRSNQPTLKQKQVFHNKERKLEHCEDSTEWYKKDAPSKDCAWVAEYLVRCDAKGWDNTLASESCAATCSDDCTEELVGRTEESFAGTWWIVPGVYQSDPTTLPFDWPYDTLPAYMMGTSDGETTVGEPVYTSDQTIWYFEGYENGYLFGYSWTVLLQQINGNWMPITFALPAPRKIMCSVGVRNTYNVAGWTYDQSSVVFQFYEGNDPEVQEIGYGAFDYEHDWFVMQIVSASTIAHWSYMVEWTDLDETIPGFLGFTIQQLLDSKPPYQYGYASPSTVDKVMLDYELFQTSNISVFDMGPQQ